MAVPGTKQAPKEATHLREWLIAQPANGLIWYGWARGAAGMTSTELGILAAVVALLALAFGGLHGLRVVIALIVCWWLVRSVCISIASRHKERRKAEQEGHAGEQEYQAHQDREAAGKPYQQGEQASQQSEATEWWTVLEVTPDASSEEIRRAYYRKVQQCHPDRVTRLAAEFVELAERRTRALNAAYDEAIRARWNEKEPNGGQVERVAPPSPTPQPPKSNAERQEARSHRSYRMPAAAILAVGVSLGMSQLATRTNSGLVSEPRTSQSKAPTDLKAGRKENAPATIAEIPSPVSRPAELPATPSRLAEIPASESPLPETPPSPNRTAELPTTPSRPAEIQALPSRPAEMPPSGPVVGGRASIGRDMPERAQSFVSAMISMWSRTNAAGAAALDYL
jgi:hypothetical protein